MCDQANLKRWAKGELSRREFGVMGGAAALTACTGGEASGSKGEALAPGLVQSEVSFVTEDGTMDAIFIHPEEGEHPGVIHWPDIAGIRPAHIEMARRTAAEGFAVLLVNPYYRDVAGQIWESFADFADGGWDTASQYRANLSSFAVRRDARAIVGWLDAQPQLDTDRGIGAEGYCMGGPFTVYSAAEMPGRVTAAASFHGGGLVRDDEESPHKLIADTNAHYLIAIAQDDDAKAPDDKTAFREAADGAGRPAVIDVFAGDHGWTVLDSPAYAKEEAERAYAEKLKLYRTGL
ncbi:dienelactone hydrolase family protein [Altererythrobacter sp. JGD-16]|uniref:Dienelactone hydrolase family protein n=2 Tax=Altererythrobacter lutimaris TaxID=2743979 RepID=A0A850H6X7_9SPHN|nr:dienelactone hydrolase family protein [Altererythrobacter lutimaris]